jgi:alpha-aminoadipate carrier protein LysW
MSNLLLTGICPICDGNIKMASDTTESEVISCPECKTRLVVDKVTDKTVSLSKAPEVEEDWGE